MAILSVILVILVVILVANNGSLRFPSKTPATNPTLVYIDGIDRLVSYRGSWTGYEGPAVNDSCVYCPVGAQAGGALDVPLATWSLPQNVSLWIYTNVSGPFLVQVPGCGPAPCVFPWVHVWSYHAFFQKGALTSTTFFGTFELPSRSGPPPNIIDLNVTFCPVPVCAPPPS